MSGLLKHGRGLLVLVAVMAFALAACGSSGGGKSTSGATENPGQSPVVTPSPGEATETPAGEETPTPGGGWANVTSYKFAMTFLGGTLTSTFSMFGATEGTPFTMSGTVITSPEAAIDLKMGTWRIIEVGGKDYMDMGTGTYMVTDASGMAESMSMESMFTGLEDTSNSTYFDNVGTETVNGVQATHFKGKEAWLSQYCAEAAEGVVSCTADIWIANASGIPTKMDVTGKDASDQLIYHVTFDITNINDSANKVEAPEV